MAIQGFTLFEVGALVGTLLWGWLSDGERSSCAGSCVALALIVATLGVYRHASNYLYLASLFALGFTGVWAARLLVNNGGCRFVPKKAIGAAAGRYQEPSLILSAIALPAGSGRDCRRRPHFGLTGWAGTFAMDAADHVSPDGDGRRDGRRKSAVKKFNKLISPKCVHW